MKIKIISNVAFQSKVLLEGEMHDIPDDIAEGFIARKVAEPVVEEAVLEDVVQAEPVVEEATRQVGQPAVETEKPSTQEQAKPALNQKKGRR